MVRVFKSESQSCRYSSGTLKLRYGFFDMSYETRVDEIVGKDVAEFQLELHLAETMRDCLEKPCQMPSGYPLRVWLPHHVCTFSPVMRFIPNARGSLNNGVQTTTLRLHLANGYALGAYSR